MRIRLVWVFALFALACGSVLAGDGIVVSVTGGKNPSTDRIVEQELDLAGVAKLLGNQAAAEAKAVRVIEIDSDGADIGTMVSQVDSTGLPGKYVVCWQIPGELSAGKTRMFRIALDGKYPVPAPAKPVSASTDGNITTVKNGGIEVTYLKGMGGFPGKFSVNGVTASISWADKIFDGTEYRLANHAAESVRLLASGPLRVVCETKSDYKKDEKNAASRPTATYRFTHYAGEPVVRMNARVTQDFAHQWISLHFVEINYDGAPVTKYTTDSASGTIRQSGNLAAGKEWAAVHGEKLLLGVCYSIGSAVYDGGGKWYRGYVKSGVAPMSSLSHPWKCALFMGNGPGDLKSLQVWNKIVSDPPSISVKLETLDRQIKELAGLLEERCRTLDKLSGESWVAAHVQTYIGQNKLQRVIDGAARGDFEVAVKSLAEVKAVLKGEDDNIQAVSKGPVLSGTASGYPFIANDKVVCIWSRPEQGAGLISIYDRQGKHEFLNTDSASAPFWQASVKKGAGGKGYASVGTACKVEATLGGLKFAWDGTFGVRVEARLAPDESLIRLRLKAVTNADDEGIQNMTFPVVEGIRPISTGAAEDVVLDTAYVGNLHQSPLISGKLVQIGYPCGMQFTALQARGQGLYFADEDPDANRKDMTWSPDRSADTLNFSMSRPVLGWGGADLVKEYTSPGDVVIGPFKGDWYDAAQLYRKWALTAPWCAKGPIALRTDTPKWLASSSYWTQGNLKNSDEVASKIKIHDFFGLPAGIFHAYGYYAPTDDNRYPEVWPPSMGSEGFQHAVATLHAKGVRIVPYINGQLWDTDTESYRMEQAADRAALRTSDGGGITYTSYAGGKRLSSMCPGTKLWQDKLIAASKEGASRYGVDGWYYDFLTIHNLDCFNPTHGHPVAGGNFWTKSVRELYGRLRKELKAINSEIIMCGEDNAEWVIDLFDTQLSLGKVGTKAPLYQAVYHDYTMLFGGQPNRPGPCVQGRWWLMGNQNGWNSCEYAYANPEKYADPEMFRKEGEYYRRLLRCRHEFGLPYLVYGRMLRPPRITGDLPTVTGQSSCGPYTVPVVEGSAWQAPDGTAGVFFLNYDEKPQEFTWTVDLGESAGWKAGDKVKLSQWTEADGLKPLEESNGGRLTRNAKLEGRGVLALKLEVIR